MAQNDPLDSLVRHRIRGLRLARGWTLDALASRCFMSASSLSRIETGQRRVGLDQLVAIARALGTSLDALVEPAGDEDVVIRPEPEVMEGRTAWLLSRESDARGVTVAKMRIEPTAPEQFERDPSPRVHPGREWFTVLAGTIQLTLGERQIEVEAGQAAEFSCMEPHRIEAHGGVAEILTIFDRDGERAHLAHGALPARTD